MASRSRGKSRKPAPKAARSSPKKAAKAKKAVRRAPNKAANARKAARPAKRASPKTARKKAVKAKPHTEQARAAVARRRPMPAGASKAELQAEHDHQDPRLAGIPGVAHEGSKVQSQNYGDFKERAVARMDKPANWFRRGAKPKQ